MLTGRILTDRMIDAPNVDEREFEQGLAWRRRINRRSQDGLLGIVPRWIGESNDPGIGTPGRPLRVLDVGTGLADIPLAIVRWNRGRDITVEVTAAEAHAKTFELASRNVGECREIRLVHADARDLMDHFEPGTFDVVHAGFVLNRLPDIEVLTVLRIMDRLSRHVVVWHDVVRSVAARAALWCGTRRSPAIVRHDARASADAGFTRGEAVDIAHRVGLENASYSGAPWWFCLTSQKESSW